MKRVIDYIGCLLFLLIGMLACSEVEKPLYLTPELKVLEATEVTRNSATLSCEISLEGKESITEIKCFYGVSQETKEMVECEVMSLNPSVSIVNLLPNTTYYYCFEVGNGYSKHRSDLHHFVTDPNQAPVVGGLQLLGKGPVSVMLQFDLLDDGGEDLLAAGFYVKEENGQEERVMVNCEAGSVFLRLGDLTQLARYEVQGFAKNALGETRTEKQSFRTEQSIVVVEPGTLQKIIGKENIYQFNELAVSGPLNGTDWVTLREMMGRDIHGNLTEGRMRKLDLTDVTIVNGGSSYDGNHYTEKDVLGTGMFAGCLFLEELSLPYGTVEIEKGAFDDCPELKRLCVPATTEKVQSSKDCRSLTQIDVASSHRKYASYDGCLYSRDYTVLYWWPEGKIQMEKPFPEQLKRIGMYAFQQAQMKELSLPSSVEELEMGAFYGSLLESFVVPEKVTALSTALFQRCGKLKKIQLGRDVGILSAYVFDGCPLEHLYVPIKEFLPICHEEAFTGMNSTFSECVLHVPIGYKGMYRNASIWGKFLRIEDDIAD